MKCLKIILLTVITSMVGQVGFTQKTITLDFAQRSISLDSVKKIKHGELYKVQIKNINVNLYDISINKKDSIITSNVTFPTLDLLGLDALNGVIQNIIPPTSSIKSLESEKDEVKKRTSIIDNKIKHYEDKQQSANEKIEEAKGAINKNKAIKGFIAPKELDSINKEYQDIIILNISRRDSCQTVINELKKDRILIIKELDVIEKKLKEQEQDAKVKILNEISKYQDSTKNTLTNTKKIIQLSDSLIVRLNNQAFSYYKSLTTKDSISQYIFDPKLNFNSVFDLSQQLRDTLAKRKSEITNYRSHYKKYTDSLLRDVYNTELLKKDSLIKLKNSELMEAFSTSVSILEKALEKIAYEKISTSFQTLIHLENNNGHSYTSLPLQHNGDISQLTITITPKKLEYGQSYTAHYEFPKRKFYAGIGGSFYYGNSFRNDVYSVQELQITDTTSQFFIVNEEEKKGEVGFATLLHVGWKIYKDWVGLHGTVGPAISLYSKPQFRTALGVGISIGKKNNMVSFDVLGMMGNVQRRSNVYYEGTPYSVKPEQISISKLSSSFAFSVGYIYRF